MSDPITTISSMPAVADAQPLLQARFRALDGAAKATPEQLKKVAQDFEGVLLEKLMQEMQNTIPESELFSGAGMKQIQSMFWSFLSDEIAQNGGIGLADSLYHDLCRSAGVNADATNNASPTRNQVAKYLESAADTTPRMELKR